MKIFLITTLLAAGAAFADDRFADVQAELKSQGFYYGEVDGHDGAESSAAIRRFQIRNGLEVTGKLNDETLAALGIGATKPAAPPPKPTPQFNPPPPGKPNPGDVPDAAPPVRPRRGIEDDELRAKTPRIYPGDPAVVPAPRPIPAPTNDELGTFFHGTPYATAPRVVQTDIVRKAQSFLARRGLYRERLDGVPDSAMGEAIFLYQEQRRLTRTGRLDMETLGDLNLLPGRGPDAPPMRPFRDPQRGRDRGVDYNEIRRL